MRPRPVVLDDDEGRIAGASGRRPSGYPGSDRM
jgi:hypothetical protein